MQLGSAPLLPLLQAAPASLMLQRRNRVAQGCLGVQKSGGPWAMGWEQEAPGKPDLRARRARGKGGWRYGTGGLRWCLSHPQRWREGGLSQGQATGCAACMCPGPGGCVVLGGTGPVSVVGRAVPSMGAHLAAHRVPVLLRAQRVSWAAMGKAQVPQPFWGFKLCAGGGPICSLHCLCSEAARSPSWLNNKLRKQEPAGSVN